MKFNSKKVIIITFILVVCVLIFGYISHLTFENLAEHEFNDKQLVLANQAALTIQIALDSSVEDLIVLSKLHSVQRMDNAGGYSDMEAMYMDLKEKGILAIAIFDANNTLQYTVPKENQGKYIYPIISLKEAKRTSKPYISEVINIQKKINKKGIIITVPIYDTQTGEFLGVISAIVDLDLLTNKYLTQIKSGKSGYAMLIDNNGTVLYAGEHTELVGINYYNILNNLNDSKEKEEVLPLLQKQLSGNTRTGYCYWHCHYRTNQKQVNKKHLVAYAPIKVGDVLWKVVITAPVEDAQELASLAFRLNMLFIGLIILIITGGSTVIIRMQSRWSKDLENKVKMKTKEIEETKNYFESILETSVDGINVCDMNGKVLFVNKALAELTGYSKEELIAGKKWSNKEDNKKIMKILKEFGKVTNFETNIINKDGIKIPIGLSVVVLKDTKGKNIGLVGINRNITKEVKLRKIQKYLSDELEYSYKKLQKSYNELKEIDKMKTDFINVVAHELRTPLSAIIGFNDLLLHRSDNFTDKQKHYLRIMEKNANQLNDLVNEVLELSRIDARKIKLQLESLDLGEIVSEVITDLKPLIDKNKQTLIVDIPKNLKISGDKQKITQIFSNLISNAIKYTPDNGKIEIKIEDKEKEILVKVMDNGIGIKEKDIPRIFDRFYMADASLTRECNRTGLGLAIVKENVKLHGGNITVKSKLGEGSTFEFTLSKIGIR
ncbi:MAG: ATP-binding protein [Methanosarcinales archaeon]